MQRFTSCRVNREKTSAENNTAFAPAGSNNIITAPHYVDDRDTVAYSGRGVGGGSSFPTTRPMTNFPLSWDVKKVTYLSALWGFVPPDPRPGALPLDPAGALISTVSASSEGLHLMPCTNGILLSVCSAVGEIFCVCEILRIRQICRVHGTLKTLKTFGFADSPTIYRGSWTALQAPPQAPF